MKPKYNKAKQLQSSRDYNKQRIQSSDFRAIPLNVKLTSNPFLKDQEKFHYIVYQLNEYNRRVINGTITDPYEAMSYERLHSIVCDLAYIQTRQDQLARLEEAFKWCKEQEKLIDQRKDQGYVRYEMTKQVRHGVEPSEASEKASQKPKKNQIPYDVIERESKPFRNKWRTTHKELDIPIRRLNEYKRKTLNIAPFIDHKEENKAPRIIYPKIQKIQEPKEEQQEEEKIGEDGQIKEGAAQGGEEAQEQPEQQQQQELGGFGEEPQEPAQDEEKPDQQGDKLAPRFKNYIVQFGDVKRKQYTKPYLFYKGEEYDVERRMEERYLKMKQASLKKENEDARYIEFMSTRGEAKEQAEKKLQKRLENMRFKPNYTFSEESGPLIEKLNPQEELRFGFTTSLLTKPKYKNQMDLTSNLPKLQGQNISIEKNYRKDRVKSLKNKFGKMLNLVEYEERETPVSVCQYTSRKRGLSEVMRTHSRSKERLINLDEVTRIKEKLAQNKAGVDIRSLSMGLCTPEESTYDGENIYPQKDLPSNPFMVETKKKKKKK